MLTAAFLLGSLAPDIDAVLMPTGWDRYLVAHETLTHSLVGSAGSALLVAIGLSGLRRARDAIRQSDRSGQHAVDVPSHGPGARWPALAAAAWIGALGHVVLDILSGGTVKLYFPFSATRITEPLVSMADPLLAMPLALFLVYSLMPQRASRAAAVVTLGLVCVVLGIKATTRAMAIRTFDRASGGTPIARAVEPVWGSWFRWGVFERHQDWLGAWLVDSRTAAVSLRARRTVGAEPAAVTASRQLETVRHFRSLFEFAFATIERRTDEERVDVFWSDLRFCTSDPCGLKVGGTLDRAGRPVELLVIAGTTRQRRRP
jgi:hypothetical protein